MKEKNTLLTFINLTGSTLAIIVVLMFVIFGPSNNVDVEKKITDISQKVDSIQKSVDSQNKATKEKLSNFETKISDYDQLLGSVKENQTPTPAPTPVPTPAPTPAPATVTPAPTPVVVVPKAGTVTANRSNLNLRSAPGINSPIIGKIPDGATLTILEDAGTQVVNNTSWIKVKDGSGNTGWVAKEFLQ